MTQEMVKKQRGESCLGVKVGGEPLRFGYNDSNDGFNTGSVAFADIGQGAVFTMNANTDIEVLKNVLVEAASEQYHWPGYPMKQHSD